MQYTRLLGRYASELKFEELPDEVIEKVKLITLHTIGVAIASVPTETTKLAFALTKTKSGSEDATVWGSNGLKAPVEEAAFANGTASDVMDWEDCTWTGHASAGAIPAAFAMGEKEHVSGRQYIEAVVAAYEVYQRIAMSVQPDNEIGKKMGYGGTADWPLVNWQIFASSVAAGKILGFDPEQMATCISKSAYLTPLANGNIGCSDTYHFGHGFSARTGVSSALLTRYGARSEYYQDALDGPNGYWQQIVDYVDWSWYDKELGETYYIMETLLKHWPVNIWVQGPLDALDNLKRSHHFELEDIEKIEVTPSNNIYNLELKRPFRFMQAQYNLPHCFASYLKNSSPSADWFSVESCQEGSEIHEISKRITVGGDEMHYFDCFQIFMEGTFPEVTVKVTLKDGRTLSETLRHPKGHPRNMFTLDEEMEFFKARAIPYIGEEKAEKFAAAIADLENCNDIATLASMLTAK
ncbi:MmgE/PrpD family protein [uncultured Ruthenibacterium sp.]|uniref:MmgE/PrpD family protein n=1 Tax=uncultured Ruthenibacterium sp. TaxID=1905347 RepID=UPI00349E68C3